MFLRLPADVRLDIWRKARRINAEQVLSKHLSSMREKRCMIFCDASWTLYGVPYCGECHETCFRIADHKLMVITDHVTIDGRSLDIYTTRPGDIEIEFNSHVGYYYHLLRYVGSHIVIDQWIIRLRHKGVTIRKTPLKALEALDQLQAANRKRDDDVTSLPNGLVHVYQKIRRFIAIVIYAFYFGTYP